MRKGTCKHFNGIQNDVCEKGVEYDLIREKDKRIACIREWDGQNKEAGHCTQFEPPTDEEIAEYEKKIEAWVISTSSARNAITEYIENGGDFAGTFPCPICDTGILHYSRADYNGHIHAKCSTEDCVAWME